MIMEEIRNGICQMLAEMLENKEISQEEEGKIRELFEERENRRAEVRIAYDLLELLQKEVRQENNLGRMSANQNRAGISDGFGEALFQARLKAGITQQQLESVTGINQAYSDTVFITVVHPSLLKIGYKVPCPRPVPVPRQPRAPRLP